jgi:hypothetical protein
VLQQNSLRAAGQTRDVLSVGGIVFVEEILDEQRNVFEPFR